MVFSAQGGSRQKLKISLEHLEMSFLNMFLKVLYIACRPNGNGKRPVASFLEKDEIVFHMAAFSQCEGGGA
jgi:hypothetical protein